MLRYLVGSDRQLRAAFTREWARLSCEGKPCFIVDTLLACKADGILRAGGSPAGLDALQMCRPFTAYQLVRALDELLGNPPDAPVHITSLTALLDEAEGGERVRLAARLFARVRALGKTNGWLVGWGAGRPGPDEPPEAWLNANGALQSMPGPRYAAGSRS